MQRAFVTILMNSDPGIYSYVLTNVLTLVWSLLHKFRGQSYPVLVIVTPEVPVADRATLTRLGARIVEVNKVRVSSMKTSDGQVMDLRRRDQLTKIHLWNQTEFDELAYYDSDMYFHLSPADVFDHCPQTARICAAQLLFPHKHSTARTHSAVSYNSGLMVMRPSAAEADSMWRGRAASRSAGCFAFRGGVLATDCSSVALRCDCAATALLATVRMPCSDACSSVAPLSGTLCLCDCACMLRVMLHMPSCRVALSGRQACVEEDRRQRQQTLFSALSPPILRLALSVDCVEIVSRLCRDCQIGQQRAARECRCALARACPVTCPRA